MTDMNANTVPIIVKITIANTVAVIFNSTCIDLYIANIVHFIICINKSSISNLAAIFAHLSGS